MNNKDDYPKKALVVTTVASTLDQFCMNDISILQKSFKVHVAANFSVGNNTSKLRIKEFKSELRKKNISISEINFNRNPFSLSNIRAYREIREIIKYNSFDLIHCHTPVAAMVVRLAARGARKKGTKVIYTAHGFHFFNGAPLKNWIMFYPIERWLSKYTDVLITINKEDFSRAKMSLKSKKIEYIPGVGIDTEKFSNSTVDKLAKRKELNIPEDSFVILSVGELNKNKNHETVIKAISRLNCPNVYYVICGQGVLMNDLKKMINELGLIEKVKLLGYRSDIAEISKASDAFVFPSFREGLSVALMEAMALGLPIICSNIRGNTDLIEEGYGGYLVKPDDVGEFEDRINKMIFNKTVRENMSRYNEKRIMKFHINKVKDEMEKIYSALK